MMLLKRSTIRGPLRIDCVGVQRMLLMLLLGWRRPSRRVGRRDSSECRRGRRRRELKLFQLARQILEIDRRLVKITQLRLLLRRRRRRLLLFTTTSSSLVNSRRLSTIRRRCVRGHIRLMLLSSRRTIRHIHVYIIRAIVELFNGYDFFARRLIRFSCCCCCAQRRRSRIGLHSIL